MIAAIVGSGRQSRTVLPQEVAAVDLGSNSFHMIVGRLVGGRIQVLDRLRERVALAEGLDDKDHLSEDCQKRALACLKRFGERVRHLPPGTVRVVGTNTLRRARGKRKFLVAARRALGHRIEIISGQEEARLVYQGVAHDQTTAPGRRLVIDIGGGSTECVLGEGFEMVEGHSLYMGCISHTRTYFKGGRLKPGAMRKAVVGARVEIEHLEARYREKGWEACLGSSGTVLAVREILRQRDGGSGAITVDGLQWLREEILAAGNPKRLKLPGLERDRAAILPGGVAILLGLFEGFGIERMTAAESALREGVLYDLCGRLGHEDARDRTINELLSSYRVDHDQAVRVEETAVRLFEQVRERWRLEEEQRPWLAWAARLHEIGLSISYAGHHKHGAYLVAHSELPGFSRDEQQLLSTLVLSHRRKMRTIPETMGVGPDLLERLTILLRLAVLLNRRRQDPPPFEASVDETGLSLRLPDDWLSAHPLTRADLEEESTRLAERGYQLSCR